MTANDTAPRDGASRRSCHHQYLIRDPHSRHRPTLQPPNIGHNIRRVVDEITTANGFTNQVTHMVYSHHHADHQGASSLFGGDIVRIGHEETRRLLLRDDDPARPVPDVTFSDSYTLEVGGERGELAWHGSNHSPDNIYIHFPDHDTLVFIGVSGLFLVTSSSAASIHGHLIRRSLRHVVTS